MNDTNSQAFIHGLSVDWKVGFQLWRKLTEELRKKVQDVRDEHLPPRSEGDSHQSRNRMENQKPIDGPQKGNRDVIKASSKVTQKDNPKIPMQCSTNQTQTTECISAEDENVQHSSPQFLMLNAILKMMCLLKPTPSAWPCLSATHKTCASLAEVPILMLVEEHGCH